MRRAFVLLLGLSTCAALAPGRLPTPRAALPRAGPIHCSELAAERIESVKVGGVALLVGSLASIPLALVAPDAFSAQWELGHDGLAVMLLLFGVVYRYAVREDENPMLKQGVVGAFAVTRALAELRASPGCTAMPLSCGAPLGYVDWSMILSGTFGLVEALVACRVDAGARRHFAPQSLPPVRCSPPRAAWGAQRDPWARPPTHRPNRSFCWNPSGGVWRGGRGARARLQPRPAAQAREVAA